MRRLAATVTIISTEEGGRRFGMTVTAIASVSMEPPSLLVSVNSAASIHDPLRRRGAFCVNVLGSGHEQHCADFAGAMPSEARFGCGRWGTRGDLPYLLDAPANVFCVVDKEVAYGTHTIFIARVQAVVLAGEASPLVYLDGGFLGAAAAMKGRSG